MRVHAAKCVWAAGLACLLTGATSQAQQNNEVSANKIKIWVEQLASTKFQERENATAQLIKAGKAAVGPVAEALAESGEIEVRNRGMKVLQALYASDDPATKAAAKDALKSLADSNSAVAKLAANILNPVKAKAPPQPFPVLPGRIIQNVQIQIVGPGGKNIKITNNNGVRKVETEEDGKRITIEEDANGIKVAVTEKVDGKEKTTEYKAKDAKELKKKHPQGYELYQKHRQKGNIFRFRGNIGGPNMKELRKLIQGNLQGLPLEIRKQIEREIEKIEKE